MGRRCRPPWFEHRREILRAIRSHTNSNAHSHSNSYGHTHSYANAHADTNTNCITYAYGNTYTYTNAHPVHWEMSTDAAAAPYSGASTLGINGKRPTPNAQRSTFNSESEFDVGCSALSVGCLPNPQYL